MSQRLATFWGQLALARQFMAASFVVLLLGMVGVGWWVGEQIERGVTQRTAETSALYVASFIAPNLLGVAHNGMLTERERVELDRLLTDTPLGQEIAIFKLWNSEGRVLYSTQPAQEGEVFPVQGGLASALQGKVTAEISDLGDEENELEREPGRQLLEVYSPVRLWGNGPVIAVAEFYHDIGAMQAEIRAAQRRSWLVVGLVAVAMYLLLARMVQVTSDTISRQGAELRENVARLTELLQQNEMLHERVRRAAARTTALNERHLRRISAELHDGPAQQMALALMRLDNVAVGEPDGAAAVQSRENLAVVESALKHALREVRTIATGLRLPELERLTLAETLTRVVRVHERNTGSSVELRLEKLPEETTLPVKITLYRVVQEALSNAYRHAGGASQQVRVTYENDVLRAEIADKGPGFDGSLSANGSEHLGLIGMRERVESLGGLFRIESEPGQGTRVIVRLSSQAVEGNV
ncbi:MAG: sensor histidine kinase [Ardenticatenaceae bacterium]